MTRPVRTVIDATRCTGCGRCVRVCPSETLALRDGKAVVVGETSLQCGHCVAVCPEEAVTVTTLDPAMVAFRTFSMDDSWLPFGQPEVRDLVRLMASRRSCRNYRTDPVPREVLEDLVQVACTAPTGTGNQPWSFTVLPDRAAVLALGRRILAFFERLTALSDLPLLRLGLRLAGRPELDLFHREYAESVREAIREFRQTGRDRLFHGAPAVVIIGTDPAASTPKEDALLAAQNLLLAAHAMGLGTCLIGFAVEAMRRNPSVLRALGIPQGHRVHAVIALGWPAETWHRVGFRRHIEARFVTAAEMDSR